jgi:hypothetical protein
MNRFRPEKLYWIGTCSVGTTSSFGSHCKHQIYNIPRLECSKRKKKTRSERLISITLQRKNLTLSSLSPSVPLFCRKSPGRLTICSPILATISSWRPDLILEVKWMSRSTAKPETRDGSQNTSVSCRSPVIHLPPQSPSLSGPLKSCGCYLTIYENMIHLFLLRLFKFWCCQFALKIGQLVFLVNPFPYWQCHRYDWVAVLRAFRFSCPWPFCSFLYKSGCTSELTFVL